jgi:hypothetical protein
MPAVTSFPHEVDPSHPYMRTLCLQVCVQFRTQEVFTVRRNGQVGVLEDVRMNYDPVWVLTKFLDMGPKDKTHSMRERGKEQYGGWKASARMLDHAVGQQVVGPRAEVKQMEPKAEMQAQIDKAWKNTVFIFETDKYTWQSWLVRMLLGLKRKGSAE